ncbi:hypothetical protein AB0E08_08385 [Streptomyces sp. NPDC048281]|uniref:hypothetical protein n=1 Tax=Streptomyces sp. NPDC048281 TaxID=3154715 RepID=UPI00343F7232
MDTISLDEFVSALHSGATERIPADKLAPGCIISNGLWEKHVVVGLPKRLNSHTTMLDLTLRHIAGGHTVHPYYPTTSVYVYRERLPEALLAEVPFVAPCVIPDEPAVGDRIVMHWRNGDGARVHEWDGESWCSTYADEDGHPQPERYSTLAMRAFTRVTDTPIEYGWYVYEPAKSA